jgi:hypothetical protein
MSQPESLLGLAGYLERERVESLVSNLSILWKLSMGEDPASLDSDLAATRRWFDPVAQGQRLRRELPNIPQIPDDISDPGPPMTFAVSPNQRLVTPEGRCALDLLNHLSAEGSGYFVEESQLVPYDRRLAHLYREWSRHRIDSVIDLLIGEEKPLQVPAAGVVLGLLVNRSTSSDRALKRFPAGAARDVIDDAFFAAVNCFAQTLSPKQRATRDPKLISGWMLYEARRRLGDDVLIVEGSRPDVEGRLWINDTKQDVAIDIVARDLGRGHRARVTPELLGDAYDALVSAFRTETPRLAGFGLAHERPSNTDRLRRALIERFQYHIEAP